MLEFISEEAAKILSLTVCGISVGSIIGLAIFLIAQIRKNRSEIKLTKDSVTNAFKEAILPKSVKLDISNKLERPINEGFGKLTESITPVLQHLYKGNLLILKILTQFSHVQKLSDADQAEIAEYIESSEHMDIKL